MALVVPLLAMLTAAVVDLGLYGARSATIESAAASAAHYVEDHPAAGDDEVAAYIEGAYPVLGDVQAEVQRADAGTKETKTIPYRYYGRTGNLSSYDVEATTLSRTVTVKSQGSWIMAMSAAAAGQPDGAYTIQKTVTATTGGAS